MAEWTFFVYADEGGSEELSGWLKRLPEKRAAAKIRQILWNQRLFSTWDARFCAPYKGHKGLYELRFSFQRNQYRLLGLFGLGAKEFTIVECAQKTNQIPPAIVARAEKRIQILRKNGRRRREFRIY